MGVEMKIGFFMPALGMVGVESAFENLLAGIYSLKGVDVVVFRQRPVQEQVQINFFKEHPYIETINYYPLADWFESLQDKCRYFPLKQIRKIIFSIYKKYRNFYMANVISRMGIDIAIDYVGGDSLKLVKVLHNIPTMVVIHGAIRSYPVERMNKLGLYDKILVLSKSAVADINKRYPQYKDKIIQCYNAADLEFFSKAVKKRDTKKLGKYFVSVSRLAKDKDIDTLILAFDNFWKKNNKPKCNLVIIGDGQDKERLQNLSKNLESVKNIIFLGKISKPYDYMQDALAHVLSSYLEALPTTIIESAAVGTLNIASDCPDGPKEMLLNGQGGILYQPGNADELSDIMSNVWNKAVNTKQLISNMTNSLDRFSPETVSKRFINLTINTIRDIKDIRS